MILSKKIIFIISLSFIFAIYGFLLTNYFISLSTSGDIIKYQSLWKNLEYFQLDAFKKLCCDSQSLMFINRANIGSFQFIYPLIVNYLSKLISFQLFSSLTSAIYSFLLTYVFLNKKNFIIRLIFLIPIFYGVYTFGIYSVLDRLKIALIFYFIALISKLNLKLRNFFLLISVLVHSSILLIGLPTFVKINFSPRTSYILKNFVSKIRIPNFSNTRLRKLLIGFLIIFFLMLTFYLSYEKFTSWLPFIINFRFYNNYFLSLDRFIDVFFIFILMYPNFQKKEYPDLIHLISIIPIVAVTFLIGGFRTLILAYIYFAVANWNFAEKTKLSYLQTIFFVALSINCLRNATLFISKLQLTGYGY